MRLSILGIALSSNSYSCASLSLIPPISTSSSSTSSLSFSNKFTPSASGKRNLVLRGQSGGFESELKPGDLMESEKEFPEFPEFNRNLYPSIEPYSSGFLKVSDIHTIYWEQSGNPNGHPVVFLHGGPGGGTAPSNRKFFDPEFYRIILFDQLREHLEIPEWQVFGGSWGSTLALAYSQSHPDKVTGMVLRGIFLLRKKEIDWFYEGGAASIFPDAWEPFRDLIPENERGSFVDAYGKRLNSDDQEVQCAAARAWTMWEMMTAHLFPNNDNIKRGEDDKFSLGRYDVCCPMMSAWDLHKAWPEADLKVIQDAGHSANEPGIAAELVAANEKLKHIKKGA
ncbi:proline iminopeptidase isoform X3 [Prunus yedoensis var. nudiflora]|uniref:Proline iminopeptidase isoform X3 n=1 Tax=Prunus yedoensis var. nudiflora TaxID=2094558 RepID=A0A314XJV0_PRUYE|nr:proline iminopeptidase isoform X3 [Prunus yedoensis var. nudiflora]